MEVISLSLYIFIYESLYIYMNELYIYTHHIYIYISYIITGDIYIYMVVFQGFFKMIHVSAFLGFLRPYYGILWKES